MADETTVRALLLAGLDEAFDKHSWHGANLRTAVRGLALDEATFRPSRGRHDVWELIRHTAYWKLVARRRLTGDRSLRFAYPGKDFFPTPVDPTPEALAADIALLVSEHKSLRSAVVACAAFPPRAVRLVRGVAAHDLYHAGQIRLLRALWKR